MSAVLNPTMEAMSAARELRRETAIELADLAASYWRSAAKAAFRDECGCRMSPPFAYEERDPRVPPIRAYRSMTSTPLVPSHSCTFAPTCDMWPAGSVNSPILPVTSTGEAAKASDWLDRNRPVKQLIWAPGLPESDQQSSDRRWWVDRPQRR
jgi:hypothetical protein